MDFHAHLNMNEVIGLLAGECDEDQRLIRQVMLRRNSACVKSNFNPTQQCDQPLFAMRSSLYCSTIPCLPALLMP